MAEKVDSHAAIERELVPPEIRSTRFNEQVTIRNLPFVFSGRLPNKDVKSDSFRFELRVPSWQQYEEGVRRRLQDEPLSFSDEIGLQQFLRHRGLIGQLDMQQGVDLEHGGHLALKINQVRSAASALPSDSTYRDAGGIGTFLLENALAFADTSGLSVYTMPYADRGGEMTSAQLAAWYKKHGFHFLDPTRTKMAYMVRLPSVPDPTQVMTRLLRVVTDAEFTVPSERIEVFPVRIKN